MRILFAACGSIGHIAPCVAVWRAVRKSEPGAEAMFLCSDRKEDGDFLQKEEVAWQAMGSRRVTLLNILPTFFRVRALLHEWQPSVVFTKGGGVTVPVALAARLSGIPIMVHESDAVPGRATRVIGAWATSVCSGFPNNPVRPEVTRGSREKGMTITGLNGARPTLLVMGGSQGAASINEIIIRNLEKILAVADVMHLTGEGKPGASACPGYWSRPFAHDEYPHLLALADIAVSRAGAGSISELMVNGISMILIPLRGVAHDHQEANARALEREGKCVVVEQSNMEKELLSTIEERVREVSPLSGNTRKKLSSPHVDAAERVAHLLIALGKKR